MTCVAINTSLTMRPPTMVTLTPLPSWPATPFTNWTPAPLASIAWPLTLNSRERLEGAHRAHGREGSRTRTTRGLLDLDLGGHQRPVDDGAGHIQFDAIGNRRQPATRHLRGRGVHRRAEHPEAGNPAEIRHHAAQLAARAVAQRHRDTRARRSLLAARRPPATAFARTRTFTPATSRGRRVIWLKSTVRLPSRNLRLAASRF